MNTIFKLLEKSVSKFTPFALPSPVSKLLAHARGFLVQKTPKAKPLYKPTLYLSHPLSQVVYNITEPSQKMTYER